MNVRLARQVEDWVKFWATVTDPSQVENALARLRFLEEFSFHAGTAISREEYEALNRQITAGESKLSELRGDVPKTPSPAQPQPPDFSHQEFVKNSVPQTLVFGTLEVSA